MTTRKQTTATTKAADVEGDESTQDATLVAAELILENERKRKNRSKRRAKRKRDESMMQMRQSIEVIKWCVLAISSVMTLSLIIGLYVLHQVSTEVNRIKTEVEGIQREAEMIRDKIRHPLQTLGGTIGRRLEGNISEMIDVEDEN